MLEQIFSPTILKCVRATRVSPLIAALILVGLSASAWALFAPAKNAEASTPNTKIEANTTASLQSNSTQAGGEVVLLTLSRKGFEPSEITQPAGRFLLVFNNRSGVEELALRLNRESGGKLRDIQVRRQRPNWREVVDLRPGRYVLTEDNHPDWVCRFTITAR